MSYRVVFSIPRTRLSDFEDNGRYIKEIELPFVPSKGLVFIERYTGEPFTMHNVAYNEQKQCFIVGLLNSVDCCGLSDKNWELIRTNWVFEAGGSFSLKI